MNSVFDKILWFQRNNMVICAFLCSAVDRRVSGFKSQDIISFAELPPMDQVIKVF